MPDLLVSPSGSARLADGGPTLRCTLGRGGVKPAEQKREGDGATPAGRWPIRWLYYRPDRLDPPSTALPVKPLSADLGWCEVPGDPLYNRPVTIPYAASHERMWRDDALYDIVGVLGHNDDPVVPGLGSAIFLHLSRPDWGPTEGCVGLPLDDLLAVLGRMGPGDAVLVEPS